VTLYRGSSKSEQIDCNNHSTDNQSDQILIRWTKRQFIYSDNRSRHNV